MFSMIDIIIIDIIVILICGKILDKMSINLTAKFNKILTICMK